MNSNVQPSIASVRDSASDSGNDNTIKDMNVLAPGGMQSLTPSFRGKMVTLAIVFQICCAVYEYIAVGPADHDISDSGSYGFREAFRETRRIKTHATYERKRGPSFAASLDGQTPVDSWGVSFLEDSIGGLISGPLGLWRRGEIFVKHSDGASVRDFDLVHWSRPVENKAFWDNGNPDNCTDVRLYLSGQQRPIDTEDHDKLMVSFGFLDYNCTTDFLDGFFVRLQTAYMGGPLIGDVYSMHGTGLYSRVPENEVHIGHFVEDRAEGERSLMLQSILFAFLPFLFYLIAMIRVNSNDVHLLMQADKGGKNWEFHLNNGSELLTMWYPTIGCLGMILSTLLNEQLSSTLVYQLMYGEFYAKIIGATQPKILGFAVLTLMWQWIATALVYFHISNNQFGTSSLVIQMYEVVSCRKYMVYELLGSLLPLLTFALPNSMYDSIYPIVWVAIIIVQIVLRQIQISVATSQKLKWEHNGYILGGYTGWSPFMSELAPFLNTLYGSGTNAQMKSNVMSGASFKGNLATAAVIAVPGIMLNKVFTAGTASIFIKDVGTQGQNMAAKLTYQGGAFLKLMRPWTSVGDYKVEIA